MPGAPALQKTTPAKTLRTSFAPLPVPMLITPGTLASNYNPLLNAYNLKPSSLRRYRAARGLSQGAGASANCRIACAGDSQTGGTGVTAATQSWPRVLSDRLAAKGYLVNSAGTVPFSYKQTAQDSRYTYTSGWGAFTGGNAATDAIGFLSNTAIQTLTYTSDKAGTVVEVAYLDTANPFTVAIDGGSAVTVTPTGTQTVKLYTVTGLSSATHAVVITPTVNVNTHILWVDVRSAVVGFSVLNAGIGGSTAQKWTSTDFYSATPLVKAWAPHLTILTLGTNDLLAGRTAAQFQTDLTAIATSLKTSSDLILGTPVNGSGLDFTAYRAAIYAVADSLDVPVIDFGDRLGSYATANGNGIMSDNYHPKAQGYLDMGAGLAEILAA